MRSVRCALRCVVLCCVVLFLIVFCPAAFLFVAFRFSRFVVSLPFLFVFFLNLWRFSLCAMCACGFVQRHFVLFGVECFCWFHYGLLVALLFFFCGWVFNTHHVSQHLWQVGVHLCCLLIVAPPRQHHDH